MTYKYDGLNMPVLTVTAAHQEKRFIYTPDDERIGVELQNDGWTRWKVRDFQGRVIRVYEGDMQFGWGWVEDFVHANGRVVSGEREQYAGGLMHYHTDHLGSTRLVTNANGYRMSSHEYYPFGEEQTAINQEWTYEYPRLTTLKFTGHERDYNGAYSQENSDYVTTCTPACTRRFWGASSPLIVAQRI